MPEGDTAWRTAQLLHQGLAGQTLTLSDFRVPEFATLDLSGQTVDEAVSRGKHLLIRVGRHSIHTHLKMEGVWHVHPLGTRWRQPAHSARVVLETATTQAVGFWLGITEVLDRATEADALSYLGPDLLGPDWDAAEAVRRLLADPDRPLNEALLDQRNLAGIGNLYANELSFISGQHPRCRVGDVPDLPRLVLRAAALLRANRERSEQATTGDIRRGHTTWVYRRDRAACRRCGTRIEVAMTGPAGRERATYWCPACQPG